MKILLKIVELTIIAISEFSCVYGSILLGANATIIISLLIGYLLMEIGIIIK